MAQGGFYMLPKFGMKQMNNSLEFCNKILEETGVALLPGTSFGRPSNELTARLAYVDFDGTGALQFMKQNQTIR